MFLTADFGPSYAGLSTVGYVQHQADGTAVVARTTTGVVAIGNGCYGVSVTPNALTVSVKWDTGGASPIYAHEAIEVSVNVMKINGVSVLGSGVSTDKWRGG